MVCLYSSTDENYAPPPTSLSEKLSNQIGFSDLLVDESTFNFSSPRSDLVVGKPLVTESVAVRRQLLSYDPALLLSLHHTLPHIASVFNLPFNFSTKQAFNL
jgi:hypothetical protein